MGNNNHNHKNNFPCTYGEALVSVLYGEADAATAREFHRHLLGCESCRDEISAFGEVKNNLAYWRETDFKALATPAVIWHNEPAQTENVKTNNWLANIREFLFPPLGMWQSAAAFGALAVFAILLFVFGSVLFTAEKSPKNLAESEPKKIENSQTASSNANLSISTPTPEPNKTEEIAEKNSVDLKKTAAGAPPAVASSNGKTNNPAAKNPASNQIKTNGKTSNPKNKPSSATKRDADLDDILVDEEDDSLRLTDLLDEISPGE